MTMVAAILAVLFCLVVGWILLIRLTSAKIRDIDKRMGP